jgi:O-antigen/teichoic acid export membrane protein
MIATFRTAATRALAAGRYLRSTPFDTATEEGRSQERYRRAALTAVAGAASRAVSLVAMLISIPLALGYLGAERYGVAVTITALTSMLVFADFGLGNGLMNLVANAAGRDDETRVRRSISSAFFMLCGIAAILAVPLYALYLWVPWAQFMNVADSGARGEVTAAVGVFMLCVLVSLPLGVVQRVQLAYQQGFVNSVWNAIGSALALIGLIVVILLHGGLPWVVLMLLGGSVVANALNWVSLFVIRRRDLQPRWSSASRGEGSRLARIGFLFFVLQLAVAIAYQADVVVATRVLGPTAATDYSVTLRLFLLVPTVVNLGLLPLWPAYSESIARGDRAWVARTLRTSVLLAASMSGLSSLVLVVFGRSILKAWTGTDIGADFPLLVGMGAWAVLSNSFNAVAMLLNGATIMRFQVVTALSMTVVSLAASIAGANLFGVAGIIWGTVLAYVVCTAIPTALYLPRVMQQLGRRRAIAAEPAA